MNRIAAVVAGLSLAFVGTSTTIAATINVPGDYALIQDAIDASADGDVINIAAGTFNEHGLYIHSKAVTIQGTLNADGSLATTIDAQRNNFVFFVGDPEANATVIQDLIITGGQSIYGGGIYLQYSNPTIIGCTITGNTANVGVGGGGICCLGSNPTISGCTITGNTVDNHGGGILCFAISNPTISGCTISGNTANDGGGGICCLGSNPSISGCTITGNTATDGGGIYCDDSNPTISNTVLCENTPDQVYGFWTDGGGTCVTYSCQDNDGDGVPDKCQGSTGDGIHEVPSEYATIQEAINIAGYGETILVAPGTYTGTGDWVINTMGKSMTIRATGSSEETILDGGGMRRVVEFNGREGADTIIEGFTITGGGISCYESNPTITNCTISDNMASNGGGIYLQDSSPTISGCTISDNMASNGGGIYLQDSNPTISDCMISDNMASNGGGGIWCVQSSPTISGCTISSNTTGADDGGGIFCEANSNPTISGCTITGNTARSYGGGIYCNGSSPTISDCIFDSNTAMFGWGGGIYLQYSNPTISGCTITGNTALSLGGGMHNGGSNPTLTNCTFEGNRSLPSSLYNPPLSFGGGLSNDQYSEPTIDNCTFRCNRALSGAGGIYIDYRSTSGPNLTNCVLCNNWPDQIGGGPNGGGQIWTDGGGNCFNDCTGCSEPDSDGDGMLDCVDGCPDDPLKTDPGDCGCGALETDTDNDATPDCIDGCPDDPLKTEPGICGCNVAETTVIGDLDCDGDYDIDDIYAGMANFNITTGTPGDVNADGTVDTSDLDELRTSLELCASDTDMDGDTDIEDLLNVVAGWGTTCP